MNGYTLGPIRLRIDIEYLRAVRTGVQAALRTRGLPLSRGAVPDGWRIKQRRWPTGYRRPSDFALTCFRQDPIRRDHIRIVPDGEGWRVSFASDGDAYSSLLLGWGLPLDAAVDLAVTAMETVTRGGDLNALRSEVATHGH